MRRLLLVWLALSVIAACGKSTANAPSGLPHAGGAGGEPGNAAGMPDGGVIGAAGGPVAAAGASTGGAAGATIGGVAGASSGGAEGGEAGAAGLAGSAPCLELSCLLGAQFVYVPNRQWTRPSTNPSGPPTSSELSESDYQPLLGPRYDVTFSNDAQQVELTPSAGGDTVKGSRQTPPSDRAMFELTLFAGGRFVVQAGASAFQAEYTVYGSGTPIVSSTRGELQSR